MAKKTPDNSPASGSADPASTANPAVKRDPRADAKVDAKPDATAAAKTDTKTTAKPERTKATWPRLTIIVLFAIVYAYDLFEAISNTFGVAAQITKYNENATLIGINTIAIPWVVLIANLLLPLAVFFLVLFFVRKRNIGILAVALLAGLGVVAALSLSLGVLAGVLAG